MALHRFSIMLLKRAKENFLHIIKDYLREGQERSLENKKKKKECHKNQDLFLNIISTNRQ